MVIFGRLVFWYLGSFFGYLRVCEWVKRVGFVYVRFLLGGLVFWFFDYYWVLDLVFVTVEVLVLCC